MSSSARIYIVMGGIQKLHQNEAKADGNGGNCGNLITDEAQSVQKSTQRDRCVVGIVGIVGTYWIQQHFTAASDRYADSQYVTWSGCHLYSMKGVFMLQ
jgi:membrane-bound inhibitor of C-type lysozyme